MYSERTSLLSPPCAAKGIEPLIAIWGATGAIGLSVAAALRGAGRPYRVVGRSRAHLTRLFGADPLAEIAVWDPADPASIVAAATGVESIVYLIGVDYTRFDLHPVLMRATIDGAVEAGVGRLLLVGNVYPYGRPQTTPVREDHPRSPHTYKGRMRKAQEDLVLAADRAGRLRGAVLRLPDFYGPGVEKSLLTDLFAAAARGARAQLLGPIDMPHEFVFVPDAGPVIAGLIDEPRAFGRVWHLGGAGTTTSREMVARVERETGRRVPLMVASKSMLRVLGVFNPLMRELVEMNYLMTEPVVLDDSALQQLLGAIHKTSYDDGVRATIAASRGTEAFVA